MLKRACLVTAFLIVLASFNAKCAFPQNASYYLPHVVNGTSWLESYRTTFILFNNTDSNVTVSLEIKSDLTVEGKPISIIPELGTDTCFTLSPGATRFLQSHGAGAPAGLAAVVNASAPIGVSAVITSYDPYDGHFVWEESAVVVSNLLHELVLPVEETVLLKTAFEVFSPQQGNVTLTLLDTDGNQVSSSDWRLDATGRLVLWMTDIVPNKDNFRGTLLIQSSVPIAILGVGCFPPLLGRSETKTGLIFAHVANGAFDAGRFMTSFVIVNRSSSPANVNFALTNDDGAPLVTTLSEMGTSSSFKFAVAPGGSAFVRTDGTGPLVSGAAVISSDAPVGATVIVTVLDVQGKSLTETGLVDSPTLSQFTFPVEVTGSVNAGIAFYNPSTSAAVTVNLRLLDADGMVTGIAQRKLPPGSHTAQFASELFPGISDLRGSIAVTASDAIAALVLRQNTTAGTPIYTTLPVTLGVSQGAVPVTNVGQNPTQVNGLTGIVAVTADAVLKSDGTVWALKPTYADRTTLISMSPVQVLGLSGVKAISGSMALGNDGTVWSFGGSQPVQVSGLSDVAAIHQCCGGVMALKRDGTVWAWWSPGIPGPFEVVEVRGAVAVAEQAFGGLALMSDGTVWTFGLMGEGGSYLSYLGQIAGPGGFVAIDAEYWSALGLKTDGTVWNLEAQASIQVQGITGAVAISAGKLALAQDGTVWEWGPWTPKPVVGVSEVVKIAASWYHGLAVRADGTVWVWRSN
jgi:hypothetical protein